MTYKMLQPPTRTFTAYAAVDLRAGDLVKSNSIAAVTSTTAWETALQVGSIALAADAVICVGISIGSTTSGNAATIAQDGIYEMVAGGGLTPGMKAAVSVDPACIIQAGATSEIGTVLSGAGSTEQVIVSLRI